MKCDCCKEEIEDAQEMCFNIDMGPGYKHTQGRDEWTLCWSCHYEMYLFIHEQCKYHRLMNIELALQKLKL